MTNPIDSTPKPASHREANQVNRLQRLSYLLDQSIPIPGTGYRIGLDPILGLFPAWGDAAGAVLSVYIVVNALQLGISKSVLLKMLSNILLETVVGVVPVFGDIFDATWKANLRNMRLLEAHLDSPSPGPRKPVNPLVLAVVVVVLVLVLVAGIVGSLWLLGWALSSLLN
ncbi:MAG: DUF4112 domain-containing protein [Phormidium sp.]